MTSGIFERLPVGTTEPDLAERLTTVRDYVRVRPTETPIESRTAITHSKRLRSLLTADPEGWFGTSITALRPSPPDHTLECLLTAGAGSDAPIEYLLRIDGAETTRLERWVRDVYPGDYQIETVETTLAAQLDMAITGDPTTLATDRAAAPDPSADTPEPESTDRPADADTDPCPPMAGIEFTATDRVSDGWLYPLARIDAETTLATTTPLGTLAATMANRPEPMAVQVTATPEPNCTIEADEHVIGLKGGRIGMLEMALDMVLGSPERDPPDEIPDDSPKLAQSTRDRIAAVTDKDHGQALAVNARAIAVGDPDRPPTDETTGTAGPLEGATNRPTSKRTDHQRESATTDGGTTTHETDDPTHHATTAAMGRGDPPHATTDRDPRAAITALVDTLAALESEYVTTTHRIGDDETTSILPWRDPQPGREIATRLATATVDRHLTRTQRLRRRLFASTLERPHFVMGPRESPLVTLLDGTSLPPAAQRAIGRRDEAATIPAPPPASQLTPFHREGAILGSVLDSDGTKGQTLALPPDLQSKHTLIAGSTGAGKSTLLVNHLLSNVQATDGPHVVIDPKGGDFVDTYLRAHHWTFDDLEDVYVFDLADVLPTFSFFDIRPDLAAGRSRTSAVETKLDHFETILRTLAGDRYDDAIRSPDVLRLVGKACFDPDYGSTQPTYGDLYHTASKLQAGELPQVASTLEEQLHTVTQTPQRTRAEIMGGVFTRLEKVGTDQRLRTLFTGAEALEEQFRFDQFLDEDAVVIFDAGGLQGRVRTAVSLVVLSELWVALKRRAHTTRDGPTTDPPLVNLYLDEAPTFAATELVSEMIANGRGLGLAITLLAQFPEQFDSSDDRDVYSELVNNVGTILTGQVGDDPRLARRLATLSPKLSSAADHLRALDRGQWVASLPAPYGTERPAPFVLAGPPRPPGHPRSNRASSPAHQRAYERARDQRLATVRREHATPIDGTDAPSDDPTDSTAPAGEATVDGTTVDEPATRTDTDDGDTDDPEVTSPDSDTATPTEDPSITQADLTERQLPPDGLPRFVRYNDEAEAYECLRCADSPSEATRYPGTTAGRERAICCCDHAHSVDRDDVRRIPIPELNVTPETVAESPYTLDQWRFCKAIYNVMTDAYDPVYEFDIVEDSMRLLGVDLGVTRSAIDDLVDDGIVTRNVTPQVTFTLRPEGRELLREPWSSGAEFGDGRGDLDESGQHRLMVEAARRYLATEYADDPDRSVRPYHDLPDGKRLDLAILDGDDDLVGAAEAERKNNDNPASTAATYTTLAELDLERAIWIVPSDDQAHDIVDLLVEQGVDPDSDVDYAGTAYSETTRVSRFNFDESGITDMVTPRQLKNQLDPPWAGDLPWS